MKKTSRNVTSFSPAVLRAGGFFLTLLLIGLGIYMGIIIRDSILESKGAPYEIAEPSIQGPADQPYVAAPVQNM